MSYQCGACLSLVFVLLANSPTPAQSTPDRLIIRFAPGVLGPPLGQSAGNVDEFSFSTSELRDALVSEGIMRLARLFPRFRSEDRFSTNMIGEPVLLDDLSEFYLATLGLGTSAQVDSRVRDIAGVLYAGWPQARNVLSPYIPNDFHFPKQWGLQNTAQQFCSPYDAPPRVADSDSTPTDINAPEAWAIEKGLNAAVRVGIIDTGITAAHEDFGGRVDLNAGVSFVPVSPPFQCVDPPSIPLACDFDDPEADPWDDFGHGTEVAGIVAATGDNGDGGPTGGVAGVAWGVTPISIKAIHCSNLSTSCIIARAINWARTDSIPIVNMSLGGGVPDAAERAAARNALYAGQLLVAAAGNAGNAGLLYPAQYRNLVCAVGAYFANGRRWNQLLIAPPNTSGSQYGPAMDLSAPGGTMIAAVRGLTTTGYHSLSNCLDGYGGTSSAAPVVTGVAALLKSKYPSLLGEDMYQAMIITARHPDVDSLGVEKAFDDSTGFGHVRADTALKFFAPPKVIIHRRETGLSVVSVDASLRYLANLPGITTDTATVYRYVMRKSITFTPAFESTPVAWVRSSGSYGVKDTLTYDYDEEVWWGRIVSISPTGCTIESNVYYIPRAPPLYRWFPIVPSPHVAVALTIVGVPAGGQGASFEDPVPVNPTPTEAPLIPNAFALRQNKPNPFSTSTTIRFELPARAAVSLELFDAAGRLVRTLVDGQFPAGFHDVGWDHRDEGGRPLRAGVYLYRIRAGTFGDQKKLVLLAR